MSKTKRFMSIILAVTMVFSVVSVGFTSVSAGSAQISEKGGASLVAPPVVSISATKVARVAASANPLLIGNTLVKATPSGVPDLGSATYANAAYAGETPVWPSVTFTLPAGITLDASPALAITATTANGSVSMSSVAKNGQIYSSTVTGGTATVGKNIIYTVSYYYQGAHYLTYAYSYVENILVPSGIQYYYRPYNVGVSGTAGRMYVNYRYLGVNVYGNEVAGGATHGYYNFAADNFAENPSYPHNVQLKLYNDKGTKSVFNGGYSADNNRPQASVYIDTSTTTSLADLNLRVNFFLYDGLSNSSTDNRLAGAYVQAGNVASVSGEDSTTAPANNQVAAAQLGITGTSNVMKNKGDTITATFNGPGPVSSGTAYTVTMQTQAPQGPDGNRTLTGYTSACLTAYKYDKGALREMIDGVLSGAAGGRSNPQSWYSYSSGVWDNFKALFDYANLILNKPDTNQAKIDEALLYLVDSYTSLIENDFTYTINSYIQGTTTPLAPAITSSGQYSGYVLTAVAQTIPGYTLAPADASPAKITLAKDNNTINFYYTANPYTVTFQSVGGSSVGSVTVGYDTNVPKPANPTKASHTFAGWFYDEAYTQAVSWPLLMPLGGTTLYARWNLNPTTLIFNSNNGSSVAPVTDTPGTAVDKPADPSRTNYSFDGWYYDLSFAQPVSWPLVLPFTNITVYAKWTVNEYTIHYDSNGGTSIPSETVNPNMAVNLPSQPEKIGYTFSGWYYDNNTFAIPVSWPIVVSDSGYMLYAKWTPKNVTITFNASGGSAVAPLTAPVGSAITAPVPPRRFGYFFGGWTLNGSPYEFSTMPVQGIALVAVWTVSERAAKVTLKTYKTVNDELVPITKVLAGDVVTVELSSKTNFYCGASRFVIMYDSDFFSIVGTNRLAITPNTGNPYFANAVSSYSGVTASPAGQWPDTFVDDESSRYKFVGALFTANNQAANGGLPLIMNDDIWLFRINLVVKAGAEGSGHIFMDKRWDRSLSNPTGAQYFYYCPDSATPSSNGQSVLDFDTDYLEANENVQFDAPVFSNIIFNTAGGSPIATMNGEFGKPTTMPSPPVRAGYTFQGWTPAFPATFPENDLTLTARWKANTYFAIFMVDGNSYATVPTPYGSLITAPANPVKTGRTFIGWSPAVGTIGAENKTFVALFTNNTYNANFFVDGELYEQVATEYSTQIQVPTQPQKTGYTFTGWAPAVGTMPAEHKTFTAQFSINTYYAYFVSDGVTVASVPTQFGNSIVAPADPVKYGYIFTGWSPSVDTMGGANQTFTAQWSGIYYNAYFMVDGNAYVTEPTILGQPIALPEEPVKSGYTFVGWDNVPTAMPANDVTINALWVDAN
ncbi:MAG TPA: InlB B-repeat-containing protein, partial [Clostridia bacterium]|nr:InlB B-repeat-containing protein [Clostridia bacterium]